MKEHTPGPLKRLNVSHDRIGRREHCFCADGEYVLAESAEALEAVNADLLAALEDLLEHADNDCECEHGFVCALHCSMEDARAAIAKATGGA